MSKWHLDTFRAETRQFLRSPSKMNFLILWGGFETLTAPKYWRGYHGMEQRWTSHGYYTMKTSHAFLQNHDSTKESGESWWIAWIVRTSHTSHDESHESWERVIRVTMNRMNRWNESDESRWIAWIVGSSHASHDESHGRVTINRINRRNESSISSLAMVKCQVFHQIWLLMFN